MSSSEPEETDSPERDELVAYLDGELSSTEALKVEEKVSSNEHFRKELQGLDRVWNALDELPQASVDDAFTQTTMEMVALAAREEIAEKTVALPVQRRRRTTLAAAACIAAAAIGFAAVLFFTPNENRELLEDLPLIEAVDVYTELNDVAYLRELDRRFGDELRAQVSPEFGAKVTAFQEISEETLEKRRQRVLAMSPAERARLKARADRYTQSPSQHESIRRFHTAIAAEPDAQRLQETMLAYGELLSGLDPGERLDLRNAEPDDRLARVENRLSDLRRTAARLSDEDEQALKSEAYQWASELLIADPEFKNSWDKFKPEGATDEVIPRYFARFVSIQVRDRLGSQDEEASQALYDRLVAPLSGEALAQLEEARERAEQGGGRSNRSGRGGRRGGRNMRGGAVGQLQRWVGPVLWVRGSAIEMEEFFARGLTAEQRERLALLPRGEWEEELWNLYAQDRFGGAAGGGGGGRGRGGARSGGRGGDSPSGTGPSGPGGNDAPQAPASQPPAGSDPASVGEQSADQPEPSPPAEVSPQTVPAAPTQEDPQAEAPAAPQP